VWTEHSVFIISYCGQKKVFFFSFASCLQSSMWFRQKHRCIDFYFCVIFIIIFTGKIGGHQAVASKKGNCEAAERDANVGGGRVNDSIQF